MSQLISGLRQKQRLHHCLRPTNSRFFEVNTKDLPLHMQIAETKQENYNKITDEAVVA